MASPADVAGPGVFSRPASGLIRVAGTADVFIYNVGLVSVGIAIALNQYYGPSLYQGVGVWLATLLAAVGMLFVAVTFYCYANIFPRSGGVYVFLSRTTSPAVAFVLSLVETVVLLYYAAFAASLIVTVGLSSFFATVGSVAGNATLLDWAGEVATPGGTFWIGTLVLVVAGVLLATGTRRYFTVQKVLFAIAVLGTVVLLAVLLLGSAGGFKAHLASLAKLDYDGVIATARQNGFVTKSFSFGESVKFLVWPLLPLLGAVQSVALGGEVKRVRRAQLVGMLGAVIATGLLIALFDALAAKTFGYNFQGAIGFNSLNGVAQGSTEATVGAAPWFTVLAGILTGNVLLAVIIMATFVAWIWFWVPAELAYQSIALLSLIEALLVAWGLAMAAAVVFPSRRRQFYEASPVRWTIGRVPVMSIAGAVAVLFFAYVGYLLWNDPVAAGPMFTLHHLSREFWIVLGIVLFGIVWFVGTKLYRRRRGINIDLAFQQIPIE